MVKIERTRTNRLLIFILILGVIASTIIVIKRCSDVDLKNQNKITEINGCVEFIVNLGNFDAVGIEKVKKGILVFGNGVHIKNNYVLTVAHLFQDKSSKPFFSHQIGEIIKIDKKCDLALIKTPVYAKSFKIAHSSSKIGENVRIIGYPLGIACALKGEIINYNNDDIFLDSKVIKGMSGSPVINKRGELIGIFYMGVGEIDQIGIAVSYKVIKKFLKGTPAEYK